MSLTILLTLLDYCRFVNRTISIGIELESKQKKWSSIKSDTLIRKEINISLLEVGRTRH